MKERRRRLIRRPVGSPWTGTHGLHVSWVDVVHEFISGVDEFGSSCVIEGVNGGVSLLKKMFSGWNCIRILNRFIPFDSSLDGLQLWFWVRCDWTKRSVANRRKVAAGISNFSETGRTFRDGRLWNYFKNHWIIKSGFFLHQSTALWRLYNFAFESKAIGPSLRPQIAGMRPSHVTSPINFSSI